MFIRVLTVVSVVSFAVLATVLLTTTPNSASPTLILVVFISAYLSLLGTVTFLIYLGNKTGSFLLRLLTGRCVRNNLSIKRAYAYATVLAAVPMMLVGLYSANGIKWYEGILVVVFSCIGIFYVAKRTKS